MLATTSFFVTLIIAGFGAVVKRAAPPAQKFAIFA